MKIMQINCVYKTGSTGKLMYYIHMGLKERGYDSVVCYGRGKKLCEENVYKTSSEFEAKLNNVLSRFTGIPYGGCFFSTQKLIRIIKKENPDVVHLHCINGYFTNIYKLVTFLKKNKFPTVLTHHGEFFYTANCGHAYECNNFKTGCGNCPSPKKAVGSLFIDATKMNFRRMQKAFAGFGRFESIGVSPWVQSRAEMSPIFAGFKNIYVLNGIDCETFKPSKDAGQLRKKLGIADDQKVIIHVTASFSSESKGGHYIVELAKKLDENTKIVVVGNRETVLNLPPNIIQIGRVENQKQLARYYSMADLCVVVGKKETFSMPVAEAMCCGTRVVGFKAGGPESISIPQYSEFVENGDIDALYEAVKRSLAEEYDKAKLAADATKKYDRTQMTEGYVAAYERVYDKKEG